jgi:hypothetical protein
VQKSALKESRLDILYWQPEVEPRNKVDYRFHTRPKVATDVLSGSLTAAIFSKMPIHWKIGVQRDNGGQYVQKEKMRIWRHYWRSIGERRTGCGCYSTSQKVLASLCKRLGSLALNLSHANLAFF